MSDIPDPANQPPSAAAPAPTAGPLVPNDRPCQQCSYNLVGLPVTASCPECGTPVAESVPDLLASPEAFGGVVGGQHACVKCGYDLVGLPVTARCSECGLPVVDSLKGTLVQHASPEYLRTVLSGLNFILNGILLMIVVQVISIFGGVALGMSGAPATRHSIEILAAGLALIPTLIIILGYWRYTEPDPGFLGQEKPDSARNVLRISVVIQAILQVVGLVAQFFGIQGGLGGALAGGAVSILVVLAILLALASLAAWAVQFFATMRYTRWLAQRVPDAFIIKRTKTYSWLLPLICFLGAFCMMLGPLIALVLYWNLLDRMRKHFKAIQATGHPAPLKNVAEPSARVAARA